MKLSQQQKKEAHDMMELWEDNVLERYPENPTKSKEEFRNYDDPARDTVREFYKMNHTYQTYDFVMEKEKDAIQDDLRHILERSWAVLKH